MADVRSLLRQQQASRRITHPHALYTDSGKLSCALCREPVKTEALWDTHVRSAPHRQRLQARNAARQREREEEEAAQDKENVPSTGGGKRKLDVDDIGEEEDAEEGARRKRSRPDVDSPMSGVEAGDGKEVRTPSSGSRTSNTPITGVEMKIPSRPATPMHRDSMSSTASNAPGDPPPFPLLSKTTPAAPKAQQAKQPQAQAQAQPSAQSIDEAEWAAFEADIAATTAPYSEDAVISAAAVPAPGREGGQDADEDDTETQRGRLDKEIEAEREDAARTIEEEFEEMEELEARARRLRERREALRARASGQVATGGATGNGGESGRKGVAGGKENGVAAAGGEEEDDDDDEEEDDYTWGGLRYAGRA